jgi:superfamily II DNA or RNA helicase
MTTIRLSRNETEPYVHIDTPLTEQIVKKLDDATSFFLENAERTVKFKERRWDGRVHLLWQRKNGELIFPVGLLFRVINILNARGYRVEYEGIERPEPTISYEFNLKDKALRDYQVKAVTMSEEILNNGVGCILKMATASGKSLIAMKIIHDLGVPTIIFVHNNELVDQWRKNIIETLGVVPGEYTGDKKQFGDITIATIQSINSLIAMEDRQVVSELLNRYKMIYTDEIHHQSAETWYKIAIRCGAFFRYGTSATPVRMDNSEMKFVGATGEVIEPVSVKWLMDNKYIVVPRFKFIRAPTWSFIREEPKINPVTGKHVKRSQYARAYKSGVMLNNGRNEIVKQWAEELEKQGFQVYIHVTKIDHGDLLAGMIPGSIFIHGTSPKKIRRQVLEDFKLGKRHIVISDLLGEGVDIVNLDAIIMACGGKSEVQMIQRVGRCLRPSQGKINAIVVDFWDQGAFLAQHSRERYLTYVKYYGSDIVDRT